MPTLDLRADYDKWRFEFQLDFHDDFNSVHVQELLPIYSNDISEALKRYQKVMSLDEIHSWRAIRNILWLEMHVYCPEEYKLPGMDYKDANT